MNLLIGYFSPQSERPLNFVQLSVVDVVFTPPVDKMPSDYLLSLQRNSFVFCFLVSFQYWEEDWRAMRDIIDRKNEYSANMLGFSASKNTNFSLLTNWKFCKKISVTHTHLSWNSNSQLCRNILGVKKDGKLIKYGPRKCSGEEDVPYCEPEYFLTCTLFYHAMRNVSLNGGKEHHDWGHGL